MKKIVSGLFGALLLASLVGCASNSTDADFNGTDEKAPEVAETIPGAKDVNVREAELGDGSTGTWLYCIDDVAYVYIEVSTMPAPHLDSLCSSAR